MSQTGTAEQRRRRDAERKRVARARRGREDGRDFARWFRECVSELPPTKLAWSRELVQHMGRDEENRRSLRRYYDGEVQRPGPSLAYAIGWALHKAGLKWCSGPVALLAAGHVKRFFFLLAVLSRTGREVDRHAALLLAFASYAANAALATYDEIFRLDAAAVNPSTRATLEKDRRKFLLRQNEKRSLARRVLQLAAVNPSIRAQAYEDGLLRVATGSNTSPEFELAAEIVGAAKCDESVRIDGALSVLARAALNSGCDEEVQIARELWWLSPTASLTDYGQHLQQDPRTLEVFLKRRKLE